MSKLFMIIGCIGVVTFLTWMQVERSLAAENTDVKDYSLVKTLTAVTPPPLSDYEDTDALKTYVGTRTITYDVSTRGEIRADVDEFRRLSAETLADERGWSRLGITFKEVDEGGDFTLVLSASNQMTSFSALGCHPDWSCNVGRYVIVNQDRWLGATDPWNEAGGSLRDYQHMVVNHEVGHNLGRGHADCRTNGALAAVMQQQSYDLQGCTFNPWPLPSEVTRRAE